MGSPFAEMRCSIARTSEILGERWVPLILRDIALGITRFDTMQRNLGISRKVLAERLGLLQDHAIVQREPYQDNPTRYDYYLTEKGADLVRVLVAMQAFGDRWIHAETGPPVQLRHEDCGELMNPVMTCSCCGGELHAFNVTPVLGPGADPGPGTSEIPAAMARRAALMGRS
jgi:DNA-binding HxlR family transcriptional regulator